MPAFISETLPLFWQYRREGERKERPVQYGCHLLLFLVAFLIFQCTLMWLDLIPDPSIAIRHLNGTGHSRFSGLAVGNADNDHDNDREVGTEATWYGLKGGEHCLRYATREYTAKLVGDPAATSQDMMKLCKSTPTVIHGQTMYTDFCQDLGFSRGVWGFWIVDFEEDDCKTKWGDFVDLGCALSAVDDDQAGPIRRIESHLENLQDGSSWQIMCVTTPAYVDGERFGYPDECLHSPTSGTYGVWDLRDDSCNLEAQS